MRVEVDAMEGHEVNVRGMIMYGTARTIGAGEINCRRDGKAVRGRRGMVSRMVSLLESSV